MSDPAWLWDWQAGRIVWANPAGLGFFGCETLFDLIDRPFDLAEPGVERIAEFGRSLRRGQTQAGQLVFPSTGRAEPIAVLCHVHALSDGRPGLLVISTATSAKHGAATETLAQAFDSMPGAAVIVAKDGTVLHGNQAAMQMLGIHAPSLARDLLGRAEAAGTVSAVKPVETRLGTRDLRVTVRLLTQPSAGYAVIMADDVTERRSLEKQLAATPGNAMPTEANLSPKEADAFMAIGKALRGEEPAPRPRQAVALPDFIRKRLDAVPGANLIVRKGQLDYVTPAAASLLGFADPEEALAAPELAEAVTKLRSDAMATELPCADGTTLDLAVENSLIAWRDGPARQVKLTRMEKTAQAVPDIAKVLPVAEAALPHLPVPEYLPGSDGSVPSLAETEVSVLPEAARAKSVQQDYEPVVADAELRAILDTATDGIITLDSDGRIRTFSAGAEAIFGYRNAEVKQRPLAELMTQESRRTVREYLAALQGPGLASVFNDGREVTAVVKQGGEVPMFLTIGKLQQAKPGQAAFCAVMRDITQWKKTEEELRRARDEAEQSSRLKSEFLANVSHELRTPLNAIIGFSEMMRLQSFGQIENERYRSYVNDIHSSGSHLLSLINDLLDLSKVESGKLELNFTSVGLSEVADHAFKMVQDQATQGRVLLRKNIPADLPNVVADLRSMRQIMINILSNAVKFTDPGGQVIVSATLTEQGELKLRVKDTGVGMSEDALKRALEPFRRVATEGREVEGTGLGLPLTKALAEANRTHFEIASEPGKGTTVEITFPTTRVLAA